MNKLGIEGLNWLESRGLTVPESFAPAVLPVSAPRRSLHLLDPHSKV